MSVKVDVEYCGSCGYVRVFEELSQEIGKSNPSVEVEGKPGRQASFEVKLNGQLIHSKLSTLAFPDVKDVNEIISDLSSGSKIRTAKQQPITDCSVM